MKLEIQGAIVYCYTNNREIDPKKPSIVFLHGAGMDHTVWTLAARHFARHGRNVIAVDLPGHGRSAGAAKRSIEQLSDWVVDLLDALHIERAAIAGHSLGSLVALDCAGRYPARVRALAMVAGTAPMPVSDAILEASANNDHAAFDMLTQWGYSKRHQFGGNKNPGMWMVGSTLRLFERSRPGVLHADMSACNNYQAGLERAAAVKCPVLMVLGSEDRLTPVRSTGPLQAALAAPDVKVLAGAGHTLMVEAPNALLDALHAVL
jgi:pimeloyl-ACP methyl ester carboxylesterase